MAKSELNKLSNERTFTTFTLKFSNKKLLLVTKAKTLNKKEHQKL